VRPFAGRVSPRAPSCSRWPPFPARPSSRRALRCSAPPTPAWRPAFAAAGLAAAPFDRAVAERLQRPDLRERHALARTAFVFRRYAQPVLAVAMPALWAAGRMAGDDGKAAAGLRATEAIGAGLVVTGVVKLVAGAPGRTCRGAIPALRPAARAARGQRLLLLPLRAHDRGLRRRLGAHRARRRAAAAGAAIAGRWACRSTRRRRSPGCRACTRTGTGRATSPAARLVGTVAGGAVVRWHAARPDSRLDRWFLGARLRPAMLGAPAWERAAGGGAATPALIIFRR
jgi:hypothetical protein